VDIIKTLEKALEKYETREIEINDRIYDLYIVPQLSDPELNLFEGFLLIDAEKKGEVTSIKNYYAPVSGYTPRLSFVIYDDKLLIRDHRKNKHIIRSLNKINTSFKKKIKKAIDEPSETNFDALFDRKDIIEEFYKLFKNARNYLAENIKGIAEEEKREEFADSFMMQMMTLWYLQARGFFNNDDKYLITKFEELSQKRLDETGFKSYKEFLEYFFDKIRDTEGEQYYEDDLTGKVVVIGPAIFIGTEEEFDIVDIPDRCFYQENVTEKLINENPRRIKIGIPILNLFESRDWIEGDIDEYVLGALYEKLITEDIRRETGSYYTPEKITSFIAENTIEPYLLNSLNRDYGNIDDLIDNADKNDLIKLYHTLRDIKILDPAAGSGHFLESAIDVLVSIYRKTRNKALSIGLRGFDITVADEKGELKTIDLLEIDEDHFEMYLKFFIILSRNIYGVDINPSALKVARARFFLSIAKHFRPSKEGNDIFIRFPNVHFNLREGNSLIGYESIGKDKVDLFSFSGTQKEETEYIADKIILDDLKEYLESCSKSLRLKGDINKDIDDLNSIFSKNRIKWADIKRILQIKEKLVSILIVSLNSKQATEINDLLDRIDSLFQTKFDEKFAEEYNIPIEKVKELKAFHWILNFPEIFINSDGFDVVIGNPPYVRQERIKELKTELEKHYETYNSTSDLYVYFFERGIRLLKEGGMFSYISSNKFTRAKYGKNLRNYLMNYSIEKYVDYTGKKVFKGATVDVSVIVIKKSKPHPENEILVNEEFKLLQQKLDKESWTFERPEINRIKKKIEKVGRPLKEWNTNIYFGIKTGFNKAFIIDSQKRREILDACKTQEERKRTAKIIKPILRGKDIDRYFYDWNHSWIILVKSGWTNKNRGKKDPEKFFRKYYPTIYKHLISSAKRGKGRGLFERDDQGDYWWELRPCDYYHEFEKEKIVWQRITQRFSFSLVPKGLYVLDSMCFMTNDNIKFLVGVLNSKLVDFYVRTYVHQLGDKGFLLSNQYVERIPVPPITKENKNLVEKIEGLVDQILVLNKQRQFLIKSFKALVENIGQDRMNSPLGQYLKPKNAPDYSINLVETKKLIDDEKMGLPRFYKVKGQNNSLVISVGYDDNSVEDVIEIHFDDPLMKEFFHLAISTTTGKKNYRSKKNIVETVLSDIKLPKSTKNKEEDVKNIKNLMQLLEEEYKEKVKSEFSDSQVKTITLQSLEDKIREVDEMIDDAVYKIYGITEEERQIIENSLIK